MNDNVPDFIKDKSYRGVWIELEKCNDCADHSYCSRHDESKYNRYQLVFCIIVVVIDLKTEIKCTSKKLATFSEKNEHFFHSTLGS